MLFNAWRIWNKSLPRSKYALFSDSSQRVNSQSVMRLRANFEVKSRWKTQWFASNYLIICLILPCHLTQIARWSPPYCFIIMTMWQNNRREVGEQFGMDCTLKSLIFIICVVVFHIRNSVRVVLLKAPRWRAKWAYMGKNRRMKWTRNGFSFFVSTM